jgi:hypothetical protein
MCLPSFPGSLERSTVSFVKTVLYPTRSLHLQYMLLRFVVLYNQSMGYISHKLGEAESAMLG